MPELPEVEFARQNLVRWFGGRRVVAAEADRVRTFRGSSPAAFRALRGALVQAKRRGKYLLLAFDDGHGVLAHLGMSGKLVRRPRGQPEPYSRARWLLDDGQVVHFRDPRLLGRIEVTAADGLMRLPSVQALGPDLLTEPPSPSTLQAAVGASRQELKVALMDQSRVAGLGNIHAAEALFRAGLHPARKPASLTPEEWRRLTRGIRAALRFALEGQADEEISYVEESGSDNPFLVYGRAGERCPRCRARVRSIAQGGRTTHFCPSCQPRRRSK